MGLRGKRKEERGKRNGNARGWVASFLFSLSSFLF
jgi:hypothetical protein